MRTLGVRTSRAIATAIATLRHRGWQDFGRLAIFYLRSEHRFVRYRLDLARWQRRSQLPSEFTVRRGSITELEDFRRALSPGSGGFDFYVDRTEGARWFYLGRWQGEIAHVAWIFTDRERTPYMRLPPGAVEIRRVYTPDAFRGKRLFTFALDEVLDDLRREGVRTAYAHVLPANRASSRAFLAVGFLPIGTVSVRKTVGRVSTCYADGIDAVDQRASAISDTISR